MNASAGIFTMSGETPAFSENHTTSEQDELLDFETPFSPGEEGTSVQEAPAMMQDAEFPQIDSCSPVLPTFDVEDFLDVCLTMLVFC